MKPRSLYLPLLLSVVGVCLPSLGCEPLAYGQFRAFPNQDEVAPTNTKIFVQLEKGGAPQFDPKSIRLATAWEKGRKKVGTSISLKSLEEVDQGSMATLVFAPEKELPAGKRFFILGERKENGGKKVWAPLGSFATGKGPQKGEPPVFSVQARSYPPSVHAGGGSCWEKRSGIRLSFSPQETTTRYIYRIEVKAKNGPTKVFYDRRDYGPFHQDMMKELGWKEGEINLLGPYSFPYLSFFPTPAKDKVMLSITIYPMDLAANRGKPSTTEIAFP